MKEALARRRCGVLKNRILVDPYKPESFCGWSSCEDGTGKVDNPVVNITGKMMPSVQQSRLANSRWRYSARPSHSVPNAVEEWIMSEVSFYRICPAEGFGARPLLLPRRAEMPLNSVRRREDQTAQSCEPRVDSAPVAPAHYVIIIADSFNARFILVL